MAERYHLYFDDTGARDPDKAMLVNGVSRRDGMDCFGLGGILVKENDIATIKAAHASFCEDQSISYPLHSTEIRSCRQKFRWLKDPMKADRFLPALEAFIMGLPIIVVGTIVDRQGYVARYKERYNEKLWLMCKTAFSIMVERTAKYVDEQGGILEVYFEESGKKEDRAIVSYLRELKEQGLPFDAGGAAAYAPFTGEDFSRVIKGRAQRRTKKTPMLQVADLVLYPLAKAGYDPSYKPFMTLKERGRLLDCHIAPETISERGIKFSCFDG